MTRSPESRQRARQILKMVGIREPPINAEEIAEALGFTVIPFEFPDSISGVTFIEGDVKTIGVNERHARTRQRFSIAHEIGHYLSGHESYDDSKMHIEDLPGFLTSHNHQEIEANEFASELLMPETVLRHDVAQYGFDVPMLAKRYQVSEQAMWIQLINLGLAGEYSRS